MSLQQLNDKVTSVGQRTLPNAIKRLAVQNDGEQIGSKSMITENHDFGIDWTRKTAYMYIRHIV